MHKKKCNKNIKTFYESPERVTEWFNEFSKTISEAKYKTNYWQGLKF